MNLRVMKQEDIPHVIEVQRQTFTEDLREDYEVFLNRYECFGDNFLILEDGTKIVGYALAFPWVLGDAPKNNQSFPLVLPPPNCFYLHDIAILSSHQGKGYAQVMLERIEQRARSLGFDRLSLISVSQSGNYWDQAGFTPIAISKEKQVYIQESYGENARLMGLSLKVKPLLRGHFHQAMFFTALGACIPLTIRSYDSDLFFPILIYSLCALIMLGISTLYHRVTWSAKKRAFWKKLDHCGIYLMIAGCFTPVSIAGLSAESAKVLLTTIWIIAAVGIVQSVFFTNIPKLASSALYMIAGYMVLPYFSELYHALGAQNSVLIVAGGIVYSIGAICYGLKRPIFYPKIFGYHEFFHILINTGAILHFIVISSLVA